jgi:hypothetical protein
MHIVPVYFRSLLVSVVVLTVLAFILHVHVIVIFSSHFIVNEVQR